MVMGYARYGSREIQVRHYGGTWFVVRRDQYPHTTGSPMVTRQGECRWVGARQGNDADGGFTFRRYERPDSDPVER